MRRSRFQLSIGKRGSLIRPSTGLLWSYVFAIWFASSNYISQNNDYSSYHGRALALAALVLCISQVICTARAYAGLSKPAPTWSKILYSLLLMPPSLFAIVSLLFAYGAFLILLGLSR